MRTWARASILTSFAVLGAWGLHEVPDLSFWPAALGAQLGGLVLITSGVFAAEQETTCCHVSLGLFFLQAGAALLGAGSMAALVKERIYSNLRGSVVAQLMQTCTQAFALVSMAVLVLVPIRQSALPSIVAAGGSLRRWHARKFRRPRQLVVPDFCAEAPGSCNICLNELWDDESKDGLLRLACGHVFHTSCISGWLEHRTTCPMCRRLVGDLRKCTQIYEKPPPDDPLQPDTLGTHHAAVVTLLGGSSGRSVEGLEPRLPVLSMLMPPPAVQVTAVTSSTGSPRTSPRGEAARPALHGPRSSTLGAVPEVGVRSDSGPVELRHHGYIRPPRLDNAQGASHRWSRRSLTQASGASQAIVAGPSSQARPNAASTRVQAWGDG